MSSKAYDLAREGHEMGMPNGEAPRENNERVTDRFSHLHVKAPTGSLIDVQPGTARRSTRLEPFFIGVAGKYILRVPGSSCSSPKLLQCVWQYRIATKK